MTESKRAVIYQGHDNPHDGSLETAYDHCNRRGYVLVGVIRSLGVGEQMVMDGRADIVVLASRRDLTFPMEILTCDLPVKQLDRPERPRRTRRRLL